jgi:hypothetical protein
MDTSVSQGRTLKTRSLPANARHYSFVLKSALISGLLLSAGAVSSRAQNDAINAGGNWMEYRSEDTMTAARRVRFELRADGQPRQPEPFQPRVEILCENGSYKASNFTPGVRLAPPNRPGFWGQPQMEVTVRVNDSHSSHGWNWTPDSLTMDKGTIREMIGAHIFRIQYLGNGGPSIAEFSPAGLDLARVSKSCGLTPKKP